MYVETHKLKTMTGKDLLDSLEYLIVKYSFTNDRDNERCLRHKINVIKAEILTRMQ